MNHNAASFFSLLTFVVPAGSGSARLDAALGPVMPGSGLRARRRLWKHCRIMVNDRARDPGFTVFGGDVISVRAACQTAISEYGILGGPPGPGAAPGAHIPPQDESCAGQALPGVVPSASGDLGCVAVSREYLAFAKPCGLHSARLAGSPEPSLQTMLPDSLILLTRLDKGTSGLVLAARSLEAATRFRDLEAAGKVTKRYLAVLRGRLDRAFVADSRLLTAKSVKTRVLGEPDSDPARHSFARPLQSPLAVFAPDGSPLTLAEVIIKRGARHQIRAHLADAGFALLGEELYAGAMPGLEPGCLYLHHAELSFSGFQASCAPPWPAVFLAGLSGVASSGTGCE